MKTAIIPYSRLTLDEFQAIIALRISVFIIEQNCPYQDLDGKDNYAWHMLIWGDEKKLVGTLRILPAGVSYAEVSIGRVASATDSRHLKLGHHMMKEAMLFIHEQMGNPAVRISAQSHLCDFYGKYGFVKTGKEYLEDGIPHSEMLFKPDHK